MGRRNHANKPYACQKIVEASGVSELFVMLLTSFCRNKEREVWMKSLLVIAAVVSVATPALADDVGVGWSGWGWRDAR